MKLIRHYTNTRLAHNSNIIAGRLTLLYPIPHVIGENVPMKEEDIWEQRKPLSTLEQKR